jgi:hypothetical protein
LRGAGRPLDCYACLTKHDDDLLRRDGRGHGGGGAAAALQAARRLAAALLASLAAVAAAALLAAATFLLILLLGRRQVSLVDDVLEAVVEVARLAVDLHARPLAARDVPVLLLCGVRKGVVVRRGCELRERARSGERRARRHSAAGKGVI